MRPLEDETTAGELFVQAMRQEGIDEVVSAIYLQYSVARPFGRPSCERINAEAKGGLIFFGCQRNNFLLPAVPIYHVLFRSTFCRRWGRKTGLRCGIFSRRGRPTSSSLALNLLLAVTEVCLQ